MPELEPHFENSAPGGYLISAPAPQLGILSAQMYLESKIKLAADNYKSRLVSRSADPHSFQAVAGSM